MTDIAAIAARHVRVGVSLTWGCSFCDQRWPCDAARLLGENEKLTAALRDTKQRREILALIDALLAPQATDE